MIKWIIPLVLLSACVNSNSEPLEEKGVIMEYVPELILQKESSKKSVNRLKSICLPAINEEFEALKMQNENSANVYEYLVLHLDSLAKRTVLEMDDFWGTTKWVQRFKNGVFYSYSLYVEVGFGGELYTKCRDKEAFFSVISKVIERRDNQDSNVWGSAYVWKDYSTLYEPKTELEGCHYTIKVDEKEYYFLTWTCGC